MAPRSTVSFRARWRASWQHRAFRRVVAGGLALLAIYGACMPAYFGWLQARPGVSLRDPVLDILPALDLSGPICLLIYGTLFYMIGRAVQWPALFVRFLLGYLCLAALRLVALTLVPLEPPADLAPLSDGFTWWVYGGRVVTKDLFFSGHTATIILIFLTLPGKWERLCILLTAIALAVLLLLQHIHYTIDVLAAIPAAMLAYRISHSLETNILLPPKTKDQNPKTTN